MNRKTFIIFDTSKNRLWRLLQSEMLFFYWCSFSLAVLSPGLYLYFFPRPCVIYYSISLHTFNPTPVSVTEKVSMLPSIAMSAVHAAQILSLLDTTAFLNWTALSTKKEYLIYVMSFLNEYIGKLNLSTFNPTFHQMHQSFNLPPLYWAEKRRLIQICTQCWSYFLEQFGIWSYLFVFIIDIGVEFLRTPFYSSDQSNSVESFV